MERLRVIVLDSSDEPANNGFLDSAGPYWLELRLRERPLTSTILAMHHPPFPTGVRRFDRRRFEGRDRLAEIVRVHPQISRIICGHVHQPLASRWCGTLGVSSPAPRRRSPSIRIVRGSHGKRLIHVATSRLRQTGRSRRDRRVQPPNCVRRSRPRGRDRDSIPVGVVRSVARRRLPPE
jgi:3',5'-cyclic AMP phosphodiesterase CpdA